MKILAIESSCDETSAAVIGEKNKRPLILSNVVASQIDLHKKYGGVVPEVAARAHIESIIPVIKEALFCAKVMLEEIDKIAVTVGPGLVGSLIVGVETAKAIAISRDLPIIPINHLEGHIYAPFAYNSQIKKSEPKFPVLTLLVSGGNTLLILMKSHGSYEIIGRTKDDAVGEAFDKVAKYIGLSYPGGPEISKMAQKGNPSAFSFPIIDLTKKPHKDESGFLVRPVSSCDFSFSGLKTAVTYEIKSLKKIKSITAQDISDISASFQAAAIGALVQNTKRALLQYSPQSLILAGGVAANRSLRGSLEGLIESEFSQVEFFVPDFELCTDNAAMIGVAAFYKNNVAAEISEIVASPNLSL